MSRPVHWITTEALESLADTSRRDIEFGTDSEGDYGVVTTAEGTEWRARIGVTA